MMAKVRSFARALMVVGLVLTLGLLIFFLCREFIKQTKENWHNARIDALLGEYESDDDQYKGIVQFKEGKVLRIRHDDIALGVSGKCRFIDDETLEFEYLDPEGDTATRTWKVKRVGVDRLEWTNRAGKIISLRRLPTNEVFLLGDSHQSALKNGLTTLRDLTALLEKISDEKSVDSIELEFKQAVMELGMVHKRLRKLGEIDKTKEEELAWSFKEYLDEYNKMEQVRKKVASDPALAPKSKSLLRRLVDTRNW